MNLVEEILVYCRHLLLEGKVAPEKEPTQDTTTASRIGTLFTRYMTGLTHVRETDLLLQC